MKNLKVLAVCAVFLFAVAPFTVFGRQINEVEQSGQKGITTVTYDPQARFRIELLDYPARNLEDAHEFLGKRIGWATIVYGNSFEIDANGVLRTEITDLTKTVNGVTHDNTIVIEPQEIKILLNSRYGTVRTVVVYEVASSDGKAPDTLLSTTLYGRGAGGVWEIVDFTAPPLLQGSILQEKQDTETTAQTSGPAAIGDENIEKLSETISELTVRFQPLLEKLQLRLTLWQHWDELNEILPQLSSEYRSNFYKIVINTFGLELRMLQEENLGVETEAE